MPHFGEVSLENAERRHAQIENVQVQWELAWNADKLDVRLFGIPEQRPFQLYVVVEETVLSGETIPDSMAALPSASQLTEQIHTPLVAELVNQLVFVPEEFFDKEQEALAHGRKIWQDFIRRFTESRPPAPGDPIDPFTRPIASFSRARRARRRSRQRSTIKSNLRFVRLQSAVGGIPQPGAWTFQNLAGY